MGQEHGAVLPLETLCKYCALEKPKELFKPTLEPNLLGPTKNEEARG